jgi:hypothetical protein
MTDMKSLSSMPVFIRNMMLALFSISLFSAFAPTGLDSYEIYLNNKLLIRQFVDKPLNLNTLDLSEAKAGDNVSVRYMQCNAPGKTAKNRSISIRDEQGNIVKEWKFRDDEVSGMTIPVKELVDVRKQSKGSLNLYYAADGLRQGQKLASLKVTEKKNT